MKRVLTALALIPVVLLIVFKAPLWLFVPAVGVFTAIGLREYLSMVEASGVKAFRWPTYTLGLLPLAALLAVSLPEIWHPRDLPPDLPYQSDLLPLWLAICFIAPAIFGTLLVFRKELRNGMASVSACMFGIFYVALPLSLTVDLRDNPSQRFLLVFILFSVWAGDIAAYYVGKNIGKHKLAPIVSPNKSWEGAVASVVASIGMAALVFYFQNQITDFFSGGTGLWKPNFHPSLYTPIPWRHVIALGIITNVAAQFGDLFESALKRGVGVKDSGTLLPGHGGLLDRIDALLFAFPVVMFYINVVEFLDRLIYS
ncbi:MAG: phosphatidate cytidylyltransferase [Acidobacteriia bacterium]|nr:phosphatidate cytidylyltransferase [Terriglobia bacterium]